MGSYVNTILKVLVKVHANYCERHIAYCLKMYHLFWHCITIGVYVLVCQHIFKGIHCRVYNLVIWTWTMYSEAFPFPRYSTWTNIKYFHKHWMAELHLICHCVWLANHTFTMHRTAYVWRCISLHQWSSVRMFFSWSVYLIWDVGGGVIWISRLCRSANCMVNTKRSKCLLL